MSQCEQMVLQEAKIMSEKKGSFPSRKQDKKNFSREVQTERLALVAAPPPLLTIYMLLSTAVFYSVISCCDGDIQV